MGTGFFPCGLDQGTISSIDPCVGIAEGLGPALARLGVGKPYRTDTAYKPLHGYEVSALLGRSRYFPASAWLWGVAMGHLFHLLLDQTVTNLKGVPPTYFFTYRALNGFAHDAIFLRTGSC